VILQHSFDFHGAQIPFPIHFSHQLVNGMDNLKIYIDRMQGGQSHKIDETLPPEFLEIDEKDLLFDEPIALKAEAYIADDHLIIQLNAETSAYLPCSICNEPVQLPIVVKDATTTKPLSEINGSVFDLSGEVRESLLLQTPLFAECSGGKCPERESLKKFLKSGQDNDDEDVNFPFADLGKNP
jgi:uncharacterized metal-binding protein YceD (DUF177 family)